MTATDRHFADFARTVNDWIDDALATHARQQETARWFEAALLAHRVQMADQEALTLIASLGVDQ